MEVSASLLCGLKAVCAAFPEGRSGNIAMADFGLTAFAMFFMHLPLLPADAGEAAPLELPTLFGIETIPSDDYIYIRDMLDGAARAARAVLSMHGATAA